MIINKNLVLILSIVIFSSVSSAYAEEEVILDLGIPQSKSFDTGKLDFRNIPKTDDEDENYLKPSFQSMIKMFDEDFDRQNMIYPKKFEQ